MSSSKHGKKKSTSSSKRKDGHSGHRRDDCCSPCSLTCNPNPGCPTAERAVAYFDLNNNRPYGEPNVLYDPGGHDIWRERYRDWNKKAICQCGRGYFCRPHGIWVPGYGIQVSSAREKDELGYPSCFTIDGHGFAESQPRQLEPEPQQLAESAQQEYTGYGYSQYAYGGNPSADAYGESAGGTLDAETPETYRQHQYSYDNPAPLDDNAFASASQKQSRNHKESSKHKPRGKAKYTEEEPEEPSSTLVYRKAPDVRSQGSASSRR